MAAGVAWRRRAKHGNSAAGVRVPALRRRSRALVSFAASRRRVRLAGPGKLTAVDYNNTFKYWEAVISEIEWVGVGTMNGV
jgi:hypothetical protein